MTKLTSTLRLSVAALAALTIVGCGASPAPTSPEPSSLPETAAPATDVAITPGSFTITGGPSGDITVQVADITALPPVTKEVVKKTTVGESTVTVTGADLNGLLELHGLSQAALTGLRLQAADGYSVELPGEMLAARQVLLAYLVDGAPLTPEEAPIWVIVPEERAMYWAKNITTIDLTTATREQAATGKLVLLETAAAALPASDVGSEKAVSAKALLEAMQLPATPATLDIAAADGLQKSETYAVLEQALITTTGDDAPKLTGDTLPQGMQVKNILSLTAEGTTMVSLDSAITALGSTTLGEKTGLSLTAVLKSAGMDTAAAYLFTAADGYEKEFTAADMAVGILYKNEDGQVATYFEGLPKNTTMKGLLSITAK